MVPLLVPEARWGPRSWGVNHPLDVRAKIEHGLEEAGYGEGGFYDRRLTLATEAVQEEQVLALLGVVGGHQDLPGGGDDQALGLVEAVGQVPDAVDGHRPALGRDAVLEPGDAPGLVAEQVDPAVGADGDVAEVTDALQGLPAEVPG